MLMVTTLAVGCSAEVSADETTGGYVSSNGAITVVPEADREPAPDVSGPTLDGGDATLADYMGGVVVLNTWAHWCGPCRAEADDLAAAATQLQDSGVQFLGVNIRDDKASALAFQEQAGIPYPSVFDPTSAQLLQFPSEVAAVAIPTTYIIDAQGRIAARILNETTASTLIGLVQDVQEPSPSG